MLAASIGKHFDPDNYEDVFSIANEWAEWGPAIKDEIREQYKSAIKANELVLYDPRKFNSIFGLTQRESAIQLGFRGILSERFPVHN